MRRTRRGTGTGHEFGGSGEDSFVAVVVTKLTGALLFILMLTMVIMALIPKAIDAPRVGDAGETASDEGRPLEVLTPADLPEAIAGRPYRLALAARNATHQARWWVDGPLPEGLSFDAAAGILSGAPQMGQASPVDLTFHVQDGPRQASLVGRLVVFESERPLGLPSGWAPALPPVPWKSWLEHGFGFLVLVLTALVAGHGIGALERWSAARTNDPAGVHVRFRAYRGTLYLASLATLAGLAWWVVWPGP